MVPVENGCWVDVFEMSHYRGRRRRFFGPANFAALRSRQPGWGISIDSVIVGPGAFVRFYSSKDPGNPGLWLEAQQGVEDLIAHRIGDDLDSLQIQTRPPEERA